MAAPTAWPIQFASEAKPWVKRKISKTKTEVETKEKRKKYEKDKRPARTFNIKWKEGRDWLVFDISSCLTLFSDNQGFILCMAHGQTGLLPTECICNRKIMGILCRSCGNVFRGRVRQICRCHPNSRYLMDYEVCPVCKATQFREFEEISDMECEKERNT